MGNAEVMACPMCGKNKSTLTHTYGVYRVALTETGKMRLTCKTCKFVISFRIIQGAQ